jgi:glutathione synthase/RimK-type ligase-like ATP-grasp enzyme
VILIVSHPGDDHAVAVLSELKRQGHDASMINTAQFPRNAMLTQCFKEKRWQYELSLDGNKLDLDAYHVGWWRRPQPFTLHDGISPEAVDFTYTECHEAVAGLWAALDIVWVNPPALDGIAHHKPYQLKTATQVGLPIPRTLITNDPDTARCLIDELGPEQTIYKTFLATEQCWRETRFVRPQDMALLDRVRLAPVIFQEYVPAISDIRVTVVGCRIFATAICPAPGGYQLDYRMDLEHAKFEPTTLPVETEKRILALMKRLGLVYGAIDLRRTPEGTHVFLEVNPAGEWRFVEERTAQPITKAIAKLLIELDHI